MGNLRYREPLRNSCPSGRIKCAGRSSLTIECLQDSTVSTMADKPKPEEKPAPKGVERGPLKYNPQRDGARIKEVSAEEVLRDQDRKGLPE